MQSVRQGYKRFYFGAVYFVGTFSMLGFCWSSVFFDGARVFRRKSRVIFFVRKKCFRRKSKVFFCWKSFGKTFFFR